MQKNQQQRKRMEWIRKKRKKEVHLLRLDYVLWTTFSLQATSLVDCTYETQQTVTIDACDDEDKLDAFFKELSSSCGNICKNERKCVNQCFLATIKDACTEAEKTTKSACPMAAESFSGSEGCQALTDACETESFKRVINY